MELLTHGGDVVLAHRVHHRGIVEEAVDLLGGTSITDIGMIENLAQLPSTSVLAEHVAREDLFAAGLCVESIAPQLSAGARMPTSGRSLIARVANY